MFGTQIKRTWDEIETDTIKIVNMVCYHRYAYVITMVYLHLSTTLTNAKLLRELQKIQHQQRNGCWAPNLKMVTHDTALVTTLNLAIEKLVLSFADTIDIRTIHMFVLKFVGNREKHREKMDQHWTMTNNKPDLPLTFFLNNWAHAWKIIYIYI